MAALNDESGSEQKPISLDDVLQTQIDTARETHPKATFELQDDIPTVDVVGDELLTSVFRNLLSNAVQHNDTDDPTVEIFATERSDHIEVIIADNGPGIPAEQKETVFGRGEKDLDSSSLGIGLYLVDMLVTGCGGDVQIEDNNPRRAVLRLTLPLD